MGGTTSKSVPPTDEAIVSPRTQPKLPPPTKTNLTSVPPHASPHHTRASQEVASKPRIDLHTPPRPALPRSRPNRTSDLFLPHPPAFFSPSVPTSTIREWESQGGSLIPASADLSRAHERQYLNIPQSTISALTDLLATHDGYVFVIPSDPLLHFIHHSDVTLLDPRWVDDSIEAERLLNVEGYRVERPAGAADQAGEVRRMLDQLVGGLRSPDRPDPSQSSRVPKGLGESSPVSGSPQPRGTKRKAPGKKRYILQPYLELDLPSTRPRSRPTASTSSAYPPPLNQEDKDRFTQHVPADPFQLDRTSLPIPSVALLDAASLNLPTFEFVLETDIAPGFRLDKLNEEQMTQLIREIVEDASREMEGDLRIWEVEDGGGMQIVEGTDAVEAGQAEAEVEDKAEEERRVEALMMAAIDPDEQERAMEEGRDRRKKRRRHLGDDRRLCDPQDRLTPVTPTRNPIRAPISPYVQMPIFNQSRTKQAKRFKPIDEKKENRGVGKSYGFGRHGPGPSTLALTTRNLQRQQASMDEEMMLEHRVAWSGGKRKMEAVGDTAERTSRDAQEGTIRPLNGHGRAQRPIWKDHMAEKRFRTG